jgi:chromosomal replication initiator protein
MLSPKDAWQSTLGQLQLQLNRPTFETWLEGSELLAYEDGEFVIRVRHAYAKDWLEKHLHRQITSALTDIFGRTVKVRFVVFLRNQRTVDPDAGPLFALTAQNTHRQLELFNTTLLPQKIETPASVSLQSHSDNGSNAKPESATAPDAEQVRVETDDWLDYLEWDPRFTDIRHTPSSDKQPAKHNNPFNECHTFQSFVIGPENHFAALAAQRVAEKTDTIYNPLVIHGEVGLGKTHLLHAIGQKSEAAGRSVLYVTAETFTNELVESINTRKTSEFRERYRTVEVLLVDDIQFMVGKSKSEEEFFHTFNAVLSRGGQVIIACRQHPGTLTKLDERLRVRMEGGLIIDVHAPENTTRCEILKSKAREHDIELPDDVARILAQHPVSNVRELGGILKQVLARATLIDQPLTSEWAETVLEKMPRLGKPGAARNRTPEISDIVDVAANHFQLSADVLLGAGRTKPVVHARHIVMYLARDLTDASYPQIGKALGGRNHSTVVYGYKKIAKLIGEDRDLRAEIDAIRRRLSAPTA